MVESVRNSIDGQCFRRTEREGSVLADMIDSVLIEQVGGYDLLDDLFQDLLPQVLSRDVVGVLGRNDNGVDSEGNNSTTVTLVLDRHLGLGVWSEPGKSTGPPGDRQSFIEFVGENDGKRHQFWGFGSGVSEHETLITSTVVLEGAMVETLSDIRRLLLNGDEDVAGLVVETLGRVVVSNVPDGISDDLLVVELGLCGYFAKNHDHSGLGSGLARDLGVWVLLQTGIKLREICQKD